MVVIFRGYKLSDEVINGIESGLESLMDKDYFEKKYNVKDYENSLIEL